MVKKNRNQVPKDHQLADTYTKTYRMQTVGADGSTIRTSVPRVIVEREARRYDLTVNQFIEQFRIVWLFNGFKGAHTTFERIADNEGT